MNKKIEDMKIEIIGDFSSVINYINEDDYTKLSENEGM